MPDKVLLMPGYFLTAKTMKYKKIIFQYLKKSNDLFY